MLMKDSASKFKKIVTIVEDSFIDVDIQLKQLGKTQDLQQLKRFIPEIRDQLFQLYCLCVYNLHVKAFASHEPADKTPLNSEECC
jgi:hypothetical protein